MFSIAIRSVYCHVTGTVSCTWSSLTCDGELLQRRSPSCSIKPCLVNPPVWSLPKKDPAIKTPRSSKYISVHIFCLSLMHLLPFQDQVEPVSDDSDPQEPEPRIPPQVEPDWKQPEEGSVQISHSGRQVEQTLITTVLGLQMDRQLNSPAVEKIHDIATRRLLSIWGLLWVCLLPSSFRQSPLFRLPVIPTGLYSKLATLFAFGTDRFLNL